MWQLRRVLADGRSEHYASELFESSSRTLIVIFAVLYLGWHFFAAATWPASVGRQMWLPTALFVPLAGAAYLLVARHFLVAQLVWLACLLVTIAVTMITFGLAELTIFFALLPLMAILTIGWPAAVVTELAVALVLAWLIKAGTIGALTGSMSLTVLVSGVLLGIVGWITVRTLFTALQWALSSWEVAQSTARSAREHRAGLLELNIQLDRANHQLDKANAALTAAWRVADEAERFKTEFITNISHEMRTPLNLIIGFSQMMVTSPESYGGKPLPSGYRSDLHTVYRSAQHLLALVDDVIDLTRIDAGKIPLVRYEIELGTLVQETAEIVRKYIAAKGLELRLEVAPGLPTVWVDRQRIRQVLLNLLTNGARHTRQGGITVTIVRQDGELCVQVRDTGPGIAPENQKWIFTQFHTTEQPSPEWHSGSGLGLPISKQLVALHGGRMGLESALGEGSCFWFTLPLEQKQDGTELTAILGREQPLAQASGRRSVVLVNANPGQTTPLLRRYLEDIEVIATSSWGEASEFVAEIGPVALLCDQDPPDDFPAGKAPLIRCPLPSTSATGGIQGVKAFLRKPVDRLELLAAVDKAAPDLQHVLIVDNDPAVVRMFRRMLVGRVLPRDCHEACDGTEALRFMQTTKPDLVILDLIMPALDGYGVLKQMAQEPTLADIPVIVASAVGLDGYDLKVMGPIRIEQMEGIELGAVIQILQATLDALSPGWAQPRSSGQASRAALLA
ncbi:MAG: hybrid sensor histidine kinase/response regulator [Chloroflexi bacterium]|nr:hybrid sensor histidine kinase/response regulator [Chloroflexota bacterium]